MPTPANDIPEALFKEPELAVKATVALEYILRLHVPKEPARITAMFAADTVNGALNQVVGGADAQRHAMDHCADLTDLLEAVRTHIFTMMPISYIRTNAVAFSCAVKAHRKIENTPTLDWLLYPIGDFIRHTRSKEILSDEILIRTMWANLIALWSNAVGHLPPGSVNDPLFQFATNYAAAYRPFPAELLNFEVYRAMLPENSDFEDTER